MKNRILALALALALMLGITPAFAAGASPFSDVPTDHWAYADILAAQQDGVIKGVGNGKFNPSGKLSFAEWSVILVRGFYASEIDEGKRTNWYDAEMAVLKSHGVYSGLSAAIQSNVHLYASRSTMALMIWNVMQDKGTQMPTAAELGAAKAQITDLGTIPAAYQDAVAACWHLKIINGVGGGRFDGTSSMNRATAAAVYVRVRDKLGVSKPTVPPTPSSLVGTMSDTPVTLSLATHAPITDYWALQSAQIQNISDRDAFNAACQTIKDSHMIMSEGSFNRLGKNEYYNYAVAPYLSTKTQDNVDKAMINAMGAGGTYNTLGGTGYGYIYYIIKHMKTGVDEALAPYVAQVTPNMTDRQKVEFAIKTVVDRLDYVVNGNGSWTNDIREADCKGYALMIQQLLAAMDIPSVYIGGNTKNGAHNWLQVRISGNEFGSVSGSNGYEWVIVDGTMAETGFSNGGLMSFTDHETNWKYPRSTNDADMYLVARALIDVAYPEF